MLFLSIYRLFQTYAPTNRLLRHLRTRRGLKWGVPATLLLVPLYLWIAASLTALTDHGSPDWLYLIVGLSIWNALKFLPAGPITLVLLARARRQEARSQRTGEPEPVEVGELVENSEPIDYGTISLSRPSEIFPEFTEASDPGLVTHATGTTSYCRPHRPCDSCYEGARRAQ